MPEFDRLAPEALPGVAILGFLLLNLLVILLTGHVPIARTFSGTTYANRRDTPALYWFFFLCFFGVTGVMAWAILKGLGLDDLLPPGTPAAIETAAPYAAVLVLTAYAVTTWVAHRRRRARLRATYPSAVERASGGI